MNQRLRTALAEPAAAAPSTWTPPAGALPRVLIHLTPLAPALEGRDLSDDARWRWLSWVTPAAVMRQVLLRLQRRADQVALRVIAGLEGLEIHDMSGVGSGDPAGSTIAAKGTADASPPGCERLLAIVFDVPAAALFAAHAALEQPERRAA